MQGATMTKPNPRKHNGHRRRQVSARVYAEEHLCWICGQPVDKTLPYLGPDGKPNPWAKTVDEVIPVTRGGSPIKRDNCRLAHRRCNIRRGDGTKKQPKPPTKLITSRQW